MLGRTLFVAAVLGFASAAHAGLLTFSGSTAAGATFNRPLEDRSGLSVAGSNVRYDAIRINVNVAGDYTFTTAGRFDTFAVLYTSSFNPVAPLDNATVANDDLIAPPFTTSGFAATLAAGTDYFLVNTGFANADFGAFISTVGGPGTISTTPVAGVGALPAGLFVVSDTTAGGPTFNRPLEDGSGLSAVGTDVSFDSFVFTVATSGDYAFVTTGLFDTFAFLYANGFNPASPLANLVTANDDLTALPFTTSGFGASLVAGVQYTLINTGFANTDFGAFTTMITGPGAILPAGGIAVVPEPDTLALLLAGVALMARATRRRAASHP